MIPVGELTKSQCPHCGARGVKCVDPLVLDGHDCDRPYCGKCGKNWPVDAPTPREKVTTLTPRTDC